MTTQQPLPPVRRIVTGHREDSKAVVTRNSVIHGRQTGHGPWLTLLWSTEELPPDINSQEDKGVAKTGMTNKGTICRIIDFPPKSVGALHRSITLDYIYILEGSVMLTLDDGSATKVSKNDMVVQQATMHGWNNETDQWARLLCVLIASEKPVVGEQTLEQEIPFSV